MSSVLLLSRYRLLRISVIYLPILFRVFVTSIGTIIRWPQCWWGNSEQYESSLSNLTHYKRPCIQWRDMLCHFNIHPQWSMSYKDKSSIFTYCVGNMLLSAIILRRVSTVELNEIRLLMYSLSISSLMKLFPNFYDRWTIIYTFITSINLAPSYRHWILICNTWLEAGSVKITVWRSTSVL